MAVTEMQPIPPAPLNATAISSFQDNWQKPFQAAFKDKVCVDEARLFMFLGANALGLERDELLLLLGDDGELELLDDDDEEDGIEGDTLGNEVSFIGRAQPHGCNRLCQARSESNELIWTQRFSAQALAQTLGLISPTFARFRRRDLQCDRQKTLVVAFNVRIQQCD